MMRMNFWLAKESQRRLLGASISNDAMRVRHQSRAGLRGSGTNRDERTRVQDVPWTCFLMYCHVGRLT